MLEDLKLLRQNPETRREMTLNEVQRIADLAFPHEIASSTERERKLYASTQNSITGTVSKVKMGIYRDEDQTDIVVDHEENPFYRRGYMTQITIRLSGNGERRIIKAVHIPKNEYGRYDSSDIQEFDLGDEESNFFLYRNLNKAMRKILKMKTNASLRKSSGKK